MIITTIDELRSCLKQQTSIGFVPTMGYLHLGHLSLIKEAKKVNTCVVVSIFVNPTQFAPNEDFDAYPRDLDRDYTLAMTAGADYVFAPSVEEIYPTNASTFITVEGEIPTKLCGQSRPTHFKGVTTVVGLLFHIVKPHHAYFGQKDAQQAILIQKMVRDLHMDLKVVILPIIREADGLAMSSRNVYLNSDERQQALVLSQSLGKANEALLSGLTNGETLAALVKSHIQTAPLAEIDYVSLLDGDDLSAIQTVSKPALLAVAVSFGKTRLIDNVILRPSNDEAIH